jgi:AraC-like DNA-binding protein
MPARAGRPGGLRHVAPVHLVQEPALGDDLVLCAARTDLPPSAAGSPTVGLPAVLAVVDALLRDPALGPALVARRCHLSLRSLHRLFADQPRTLAGHIRVRRLECARQALLRERPRPVASIAAEFCFSDASVFARAFREEYGHSPRACRDGAGRQP